jgi:nucleoside-diphosphate-sugar epimerase
MEFDNLITSPFGLGEKLILELLRRGESVFAVFPAAKDVPMFFLGKKNIKYGFLKFDQDPVLEKTLPRRVKNLFHIFELYNGRFSKVFRANTLATLLLLEWAKSASVENFVYLSSGEVYGKGTDLDEKSPCNPHGFYATTKYQAEMLLKFYQKFLRIQTVRVFFPFGRDMEQGLIPNLVRSIRAEEYVESEYGTIAPTFTDDIVEPLIKARDSRESGLYHISGSTIRTEKLIEELKTIVQRSPKKVEIKKNEISGNSAKARETLGYVETPLLEALANSFGNK